MEIGDGIGRGDGMLKIGEMEREILEEEVATFVESLRDPAARERYVPLEEAVRAGQVDEALLEPLERVLEIALQTGRVRRIHGPQAELALLQLFRRTGRGAAIRQAAETVNQALKVLEGHVIRQVSITPRTPGSYRLVIDTDRARLAVEMGAEGVRVENVAVDL